MERERMEKLKKKAEKEKAEAEKEKAEKVQQYRFHIYLLLMRASFLILVWCF